jgi:hypothetical protein
MRIFKIVLDNTYEFADFLKIEKRRIFRVGGILNKNEGGGEG